MVEIITRRGVPDFEADLPRGFKPMVIEESDMNRLIEEEGHVKYVQRRTRRVGYLTVDGEMAVQVYDMGPATGIGGFSMPCSEATEMAQAWEVINWYLRVQAERVEREKWVKPLRTEAWLKSLEAYQEEGERQSEGKSTFGYGGKIQRESA